MYDAADIEVAVRIESHALRPPEPPVERFHVAVVRNPVNASKLDVVGPLT